MITSYMQGVLHREWLHHTTICPICEPLLRNYQSALVEELCGYSKKYHFQIREEALSRRVR